jgi:hypothetical protein
VQLAGEARVENPGHEHSGFSVHATETVLPDDTDRLEHLARYITRAPMLSLP